MVDEFWWMIKIYSWNHSWLIVYIYIYMIYSKHGSLFTTWGCPLTCSVTCSLTRVNPCRLETMIFWVGLGIATSYDSRSCSYYWLLGWFHDVYYVVLKCYWADFMMFISIFGIMMIMIFNSRWLTYASGGSNHTPVTLIRICVCDEAVAIYCVKRAPIHEPSHHHFLTDLPSITYVDWLQYVGEWIAHVASQVVYWI